MLRSMPPHLMVLAALLIVVVWVLLLRRVRRSPTIQRFVMDIFGDNTAEDALLTFESAKHALINHLHDPDLDGELRQQIEAALEMSPEEDHDKTRSQDTGEKTRQWHT